MADRFKIILEELSRGTPVLTVNRRLARSLRARHELLMVESGQVYWESPVVLPLLSWVRGLWQESWPDKPLLSDTRSYALWKRVISRDIARVGALLFPKGAARAAYKAYCLIRQYRVSLPADETYLTEEARAFKAWLREYEKELARLGFLDYPSLMERVSGLIEGGHVVAPSRLVLAGFDEITPDAEAMLSALRGLGCEVVFWPHKPGTLIAEASAQAGLVEIREYDDETSEVRACARWARAEAESGKRVGIIVPELDRYRQLIINEFSAELDPPSVLPWEPRSEVFNVSLGSALSCEPIVRSALGVISTGLGEMPLDSICSILSSPYFLADEETYMAFAVFERGLRESICGGIDLWGVKRAMDKRALPRLSGLSERLGLWIKALKKDRGVKLLPGQWAERFDNLLKALAWPSAGLALNSREFQALGAWHDLLAEFAGLDDVAGPLTWRGAADELGALAQETIHQPESEEECPVQVLGLLESSGLGFDNLWILGAHGDALPGKCSPNPFIPMNLQKQAGLPRSTPEATLAFARLALGRVLESAPNAIASFPSAVERKELRLSPLLGGRSVHVADHPPLLSHRLADSVHASYAVEDFPENKDVPLGGDELKALHGGTGIIKEQSACPFRAFAIYRLGARALRRPEPGLDYMERGSTAHRALEIFWHKVRDSDRLTEAEQEGRLASIIRESIAEALSDFIRPGLSKKILTLEAERLQALLEEWMEVELKRPAFTVVEMEKKHEIHIGGLTINARLDRVDRLHDGGEVIIDYKTGACSKDYWLPGRPKEPQMLLYGLESGFNAIAFASLRIKGTRFVGLGRDDGLLPRVEGIESDDKWRQKIEGVNNWADLQERWKESLTALAREFLCGEARVDPNRELKGREFPCEHCELTMFCRRFEFGPADVEEG